MKFFDIEQRTEAWYKARLGKPTASNFGKFINAKGELKLEGAKSYEAELIAERFFGFNERRQERTEAQPAVRYGIDMEAEAREALKSRHLGDVDILNGGFMTDDAERYGASPDGRVVIDNRMEGIEIKCPEVETLIKTMIYGWDQTGQTAEGYRAQAQGQLLISGYHAVHFFVYRHDGPSFYERVEPDHMWIAKARVLLDKFCYDLEAHYQYLKTRGAWG